MTTYERVDNPLGIKITKTVYDRPGTWRVKVGDDCRQWIQKRFITAKGSWQEYHCYQFGRKTQTPFIYRTHQPGDVTSNYRIATRTNYADHMTLIPLEDETTTYCVNVRDKRIWTKPAKSGVIGPYAHDVTVFTWTDGEEFTPLAAGDTLKNSLAIAFYESEQEWQDLLSKHADCAPVHGYHDG